MIADTNNFEERVDAAIYCSPYLPGRKLRVIADSGCVTLSGVVDSYYQKQMAQETLLRIDGVQAIDNRLEVTAQ